MNHETYLSFDVFDVVFFIVITSFGAAFIDFFLALGTLVIVFDGAIINVFFTIFAINLLVLSINLEVFNSLINFLVVGYFPDVNGLVGIVGSHFVHFERLPNEADLRFFFFQLTFHRE